MTPLDHAPGAGNGNDEQEEMTCLFIGGGADGLVSLIRIDADIIELSRPTHIKPMESSKQSAPEAAYEKSIYNIARLVLPWKDEYVFFGIGIIDGETPAWAIRELAAAYQRDSLERLKSENN